MRHRASIQAAIMSDNSPSTPPNTHQRLDMARRLEMERRLEYERRRIADRIEQDIGGALSLALAQATAYEQALSGQAAMSAAVLGTLIRQALQKARDLQDTLHPTTLDSLGLAAALESLVSQQMRAAGRRIDLRLGRFQERLPAAIELLIFRAITDWIGRDPSHAAISVERDEDAVTILYHDDGDPPPEPDQRALIEQARAAGGAVDLRAVDAGFRARLRFPFHNPTALTPREQDILALLADGLTNKQIGVALSISARTVNFHLDNLYAKLGVNSRTEAAVYALRHGLGQR
jgi:DNA-binding CsgD family transcriptional regulator